MERVLEHFCGDLIIRGAFFESKSDDGDVIADGFKVLFGLDRGGVIWVYRVDVDGYGVLLVSNLTFLDERFKVYINDI